MVVSGVGEADRLREEDRLAQAAEGATVSYEEVREAAYLMAALPAVWNHAVAEDPTAAHDVFSVR